MGRESSRHGQQLRGQCNVFLSVLPPAIIRYVLEVVECEVVIRMYPSLFELTHLIRQGDRIQYRSVLHICNRKDHQVMASWIPLTLFPESLLKLLSYRGSKLSRIRPKKLVSNRQEHCIIHPANRSAQSPISGVLVSNGLRRQPQKIVRYGRL